MNRRVRRDHPLTPLEVLRIKRQDALDDLDELKRIAKTIPATHGIDTREQALACNNKQKDGAIAELNHLARLIIRYELLHEKW